MNENPTNKKKTGWSILRSGCLLIIPGIICLILACLALYPVIHRIVTPKEQLVKEKEQLLKEDAARDAQKIEQAVQSKREEEAHLAKKAEQQQIDRVELSSLLRLGPLRSLQLAHLDSDSLPHSAGEC